MSWELLGPDQMIKKVEKSDFIKTEMVIPNELIGFFGNEGERLSIIYQNREYPSYLETEGGNTKLKWSKVLIRKLGEAFPEHESWFDGSCDETKIPKLEITKVNDVFVVNMSTLNGQSDNENTETVAVAVKNEQPTETALNELLKKWITGYPNYYPRDFRFSFKDIINEDIPKVIENFAAIKAGNYQVQGFAGDTQWAEIPWVKVIDRRAQNSAETGLYLAYILAMDSRKLYLAIVYEAAGVGVRTLSEKAAEYRKKLETGKYRTDHKEVLLANATLVSGIVCYREYTEIEMPGDLALAEEFEDFRKMYQNCLASDQVEEEIGHSDEVAEVLTNQDQLLLDQERETITPELDDQEPPEEMVEIEFEAESFPATNDQDNNEEGIPVVDLVMNEQWAANKNSDCDDEQPNHDHGQTDDGVTAKEMSADETEALSKQTTEEQDENNSIEETNENRQSETLTKVPMKNDYLPTYLQLIQAKMGNKGYYYSPELIKSYYLSIKSKPLVMIKGRIGSGKTSFPQLFAEAIGASTENGRFKRVLVGKHWNDETPLWGHLDSRGHFIPGPITLTLKTAKENPDKPYFLLLDEMDQSPMADYLRRLLAGINGHSEAFLTREDFGADVAAFREYGDLNYPDNLYIIATINEGTGSYPIDPRIIDSGNTIRMPEVEIAVFPNYGSPSGESEWQNSSFKIHNQAKGLPEILEKLMYLLNDVQKLLSDFDQPMGYRGKNEILAFGINSGVEGLFTEKEVIDLAIQQRIIPALESDEKTEIALYKALACFLLADNLKDKLLKEQSLSRFCHLYEKLLKAEVIPCPRSGSVILKKLNRLLKSNV
ncbi:MrcB family domain-containing protein [Acetobacterium woodii]|uniref:Type IV methyl-directed restriction enzyme EcoKMcrB subunit DNA-binding domain-containing protein n=1 Tax=Acetobacterium woodii (strain ATCC 29683 / DSM 1030 / JCM 2381 / KCTC 1655 / WB1) TaxID=931626 RepID=H6LGQ9_ACEWD|nr:DUF3578 domain-containing protein [Acetobacterium woodii]AFA49573.1 hypothetical protein Awo_c28220 [Acetobacterium woodii DSM 1030]